MEIEYGEARTEYGPGVNIDLTGDEVAIAIDAWLVAHGVRVSGPRTTTVNGKLCEGGRVYVDPSGVVHLQSGIFLSGRGLDHSSTGEGDD